MVSVYRKLFHCLINSWWVKFHFTMAWLYFYYFQNRKETYCSLDMLFVNVKFPIFYFFCCKRVFSRRKRNERLSVSTMYLTKTKISKCGYWLKEMLDGIFKALLQGGARKGKVTERPKNVDFQYDSRRTYKRKS